MEYNENIEILEIDTGLKTSLEENEWYALMVIDEKVELYNGRTEKGDNRNWFNKAKGYLGLECVSDYRVYISKKISNRQDRLRGYTCLVKVKNPKECSILTYN